MDKLGRLEVEQLKVTSTTPPADSGFYKIDETTMGVVGDLKFRHPKTGAMSSALTATTSAQGIGNRRRGVSAETGQWRGYIAADRLADLQNWLRPIHMPILQPQAHIGMTPIVSGLLTVSHDPTVGDFSGSSLKLDVSAAANDTARIPIPAALEQGVSARPVKAGGAVHIRVMCDDWSKLTRLYISLTQDGGSTNYQLGIIINASKSPFGLANPAYAAQWNNKWRTIVLQSKDFIKQGSAAAWGVTNRYYSTDGVMVSVISTGPVKLWIDRIYSPDWPIAVVTPIFDGWYESARNAAINDYLPRGWGCGGSANTVEAGGIYPTYAQLKQMSDSGFDVFAHGHQLSGPSAAPMNAAVTEAAYGQILAAQRRAMLGAGIDPMTMRWHQWLTNAGNGAFDVAAHLKTHGINAARADTIDGEWGFDPYNLTYSSGTIYDSTWASRRGRFNRGFFASYDNLAQGANYDAAPVNASRPTLSSEIDYACKTGQKVLSYDHQILDSPSAFDVSTAYHAARVSDWAAREKRGELLVLNPTDVERLTYWRPGDVFMRWDGEWVYRDDPTRIAF